jgi:hypothetical protein
MRITRGIFFDLFAVHPPRWSPSMWMSGRRYFFIDRDRGVEELENLSRGVPSGVSIAAT